MRLKSVLTTPLWIGTALTYRQAWKNTGKTLNIDRGTNKTINTHAKQSGLRFIQVNLQHSRAATDNLMKLVAEDETDIIFIQEPHTIQGKAVGIPTKYKIFTSGDDRCRAAVVVTNKHIDVMLIHQLSDPDSVSVEIVVGNKKLIAASMYFDMERQIEDDIVKIELILHHSKNTGIIIAANCNARSTFWHDKLTNSRGRILEEFITSKQLFILDEQSCNTTFRNRLGTSNIDLTITCPRLLNSVTECATSDQESVSDHCIIKYAVTPDIAKGHPANPSNTRYITNNKSLVTFQGTLLQVLSEKFKINLNTTLGEDVDYLLSSELTEGANIDKIVTEFNEALKMTYNSTFPTHRTSRNSTSHRSVSWWSSDLTILRKRTNALRRLYQRTRNNDELREKRKTQYFECKATYSATIRREKIRSWKEYCDVSTASNPWGAIYKIAAGKGNTITQITSLSKPDGNLTVDTKETLSLMMETFAPRDNIGDNNEYHKNIRALTEQPVNTTDDREFTTPEIRSIIENMKNRAPGEDGITSEI